MLVVVVVVVVVFVVVGSDRLFTKLYRERELQWKVTNYQETLEEAVSSAQW